MDSYRIKEQFDLIASRYDEGRRCLIPCFDDYYVRSVSILKQLKPKARNIIDLGAGTGLLTKELYLLYPEALFTLLDLSVDMLEVAKQRFQGLDNFSFKVLDYSDRTILDNLISSNQVRGTESPFSQINLDSADNHSANSIDIISSALSIHHLENQDKQCLYDTIYNLLPHGGIFLNLDQFCAESPKLSQAFDNWWLTYIETSGITLEAKSKWLERKKLDREVSINTTLEMLNRSGFRKTQCVYQFMKFATIIAVKD